MKSSPTKPHRLPIMLTDEQREWLDEQAADRGVSVATIIREAIDAKRRNSTERSSTMTAVTATYTGEQAVEILTSEGREHADVTAAFDSMVDAGLEIAEQPEHGWVITAGELDVLRTQLQS